MLIVELEKARDDQQPVKYPKHFQRVRRGGTSSWATDENIAATQVTDNDIGTRAEHQAKG